MASLLPRTREIGPKTVRVRDLAGGNRHWRAPTCLGVFLGLAVAALVAAAVGAVLLYAWVAPGAGFLQAFRKLEESFFPPDSGLPRSLGALLLAGLVSLGGAGAVLVAELSLSRRARIRRGLLPVRPGFFLGKPRLRFLSDGRAAEFLEDFSFQDSSGIVWTAPAGSVVQGGRIPRFFWRTFGPPFIGRYRNAFLIHEHYCNVRSRPACQAHRMFYEACLAEGLPAWLAKPAFWAVRYFGPRWSSEADRLQPVRPGPSIADCGPSFS